MKFFVNDCLAQLTSRDRLLRDISLQMAKLGRVYTKTCCTNLFSDGLIKSSHSPFICILGLSHCWLFFHNIWTSSTFHFLAIIGHEVSIFFATHYSDRFQWVLDILLLDYTDQLEAFYPCTPCWNQTHVQCNVDCKPSAVYTPFYVGFEVASTKLIIGPSSLISPNRGDDNTRERWNYMILTRKPSA